VRAGVPPDGLRGSVTPTAPVLRGGTQPPGGSGRPPNVAREQLVAKGVEFLGDTVDTGVYLIGFLYEPGENVSHPARRTRLLALRQPLLLWAYWSGVCVVGGCREERRGPHVNSEMPMIASPAAITVSPQIAIVLE
jgi:hypothetical protein